MAAVLVVVFFFITLNRKIKQRNQREREEHMKNATDHNIPMPHPAYNDQERTVTRAEVSAPGLRSVSLSPPP